MDNINKIGKLMNVFKASFIIIGGLVLLFLLMVFSTTKGATHIPLSTIKDAIFNFNPDNTQHLVVVDLRIPRIIASALVGCALAVAGAVMQGITRNPMADSGLMGINAGAGFALAVSIALFPKLTYTQTIIFCFIGAAIASLMVNSIATMNRGKTSPMRLVLAGAAVTALLTALSQGVALIFDVAQDIMFWTVGGVSASTWKEITIMTPFIILGLIVSCIMSRKISLMNLGEEVAQGLGLNTTVVRIISSTIVVVLAGVAVSVVGAVGFVGLIIPHVARFLVGVNYSLIIPTSAVLGALLMVTADLLARTINPPYEMPIGALIAVIGVPFFLYLARKQRSDG